MEKIKCVNCGHEMKHTHTRWNIESPTKTFAIIWAVMYFECPKCKAITTHKIRKEVKL